MDILENNLRTLHGKLIDNLGYRFLISRNRIGTENNSIIRFDHYFLMDVCSHTGKSCHGFTLTSCCDQHYLFIRVILNLIDLNQSLIRNAKVSKLCCSCDNIYHTAALYCNLASETISCVNDLLYAVYIGCKSCNNDSCVLMVSKNIIKGLSYGTLRHGKARTLCIGGVTHQCQYTLLTNLTKTL